MRFSVCLEDAPGSLAGLLDLLAGQQANVVDIHHAKKGEITSGKIRGKVVYQPTGEPVAGATIHSIVFEKEAKGGYPVHRLNPDGSVKEMLKTGTDGSFEIDISKWVPSGLDSGRFWIKIIKPYDGYLTKKT